MRRFGAAAILAPVLAGVAKIGAKAEGGAEGGEDAALLLPLEPLELSPGLSGDELTRLGTEAMMSGDSERAVRIFVAASARHSAEGSVWNNFATGHAAALGLEHGGRQASLLLCEARAAAELAHALGHGPAAELLPAIDAELATALRSSGGDEDGCSTGPGLAAAAGLSAEERRRLLAGGAMDPAEHLELVASRCAAPGGVTLRPSPREQFLGAWKASSLLELWLALRICGVVAIDSALDQEALARAAAAVQGELLGSQQGHGGGGAGGGSEGIPGSFQGTEAASRGRRRSEVRLPLRPPFQDPELVAPALLRSLVKLFVGPRVELDTFSCISSSPGSLDQAWHNDVPTPPSASGCYTPPFGLVAIVPLVEVSPKNGATEFLAGSHVHMGDERFWMDESGEGGATSAVPRLQIPASPGSVVLFDLRLRHRGRTNGGAADRPVLYMSYVQEWFRDGINFQERQTSGWAELPAASRRLFSRLDAREYVLRLEEALKERGVDVGALSSGGSSLSGSEDVLRRERLEL